MNQEIDIVESLIRNAGRRVDPPEDAYRQVLVAATDAFHRKSARRRQGRWFALAAAIATLAVASVLMTLRNAPVGRGDLAVVERLIGSVELAQGEGWGPLDENRGSLRAGRRLRTHADGRAALRLAGGASLRLAGETEVLLDAPGRLYVPGGTIYVDAGDRSGAGQIEVVTPAGTARDLGTQFELQVSGAQLRLRVREGSVSLYRGGRSLVSAAGEQLEIDDFGDVVRGSIEPTSDAWAWAEAVAPVPDVDGRPATQLISWVARETGRRLRYESPAVEERAATVILHGKIRHLPPLAALEAMLATTDLEYVLDGDTMEIRARSDPLPVP
jgi:ferric-dicitrate binding protein FerR (iron transport regulator)